MVLTTWKYHHIVLGEPHGHPSAVAAVAMCRNRVPPGSTALADREAEGSTLIPQPFHRHATCVAQRLLQVWAVAMESHV